jgi:hypothetical protein
MIQDVMHGTGRNLKEESLKAGTVEIAQSDPSMNFG